MLEPEPEPGLKLLDIETTTMLHETLENEFAEVVQEFFSVGKELTSNLKKLSLDKSSDTQSLISITHALKGSSGNIGAAALCDLCSELELSLRKNHTIDIKSMATHIEHIFIETCTEFTTTYNI